MATTSATNQYLLYLSLVLGSIGTYNALMANTGAPDPDSEEEKISTTLSKHGALLKSELTSMLTQLSRKIDQNSSGNTANSETIASVLNGTSTLRSDVDSLAASVSEADLFLKKFNQKDTGVHAKLKSLESRLEIVAGLSQDISESASVDEEYVKTLTKRVALLESSSASSNEAASSAQDTSDANAGAIAKLRGSVDVLMKGYGDVNTISGKVAMLTEKVNGGRSQSSAALTAMSTRLDGLTGQNEALSARVASVAKWVQDQVESAKTDSGRNQKVLLQNERDEDETVTVQDIANRVMDINSEAARATRVQLESLAKRAEETNSKLHEFAPKAMDRIEHNEDRITAMQTRHDGLRESAEKVIFPKIAEIEADVRKLESFSSAESRALSSSLKKVASDSMGKVEGLEKAQLAASKRLSQITEGVTDKILPTMAGMEAALRKLESFSSAESRELSSFKKIASVSMRKVESLEKEQLTASKRLPQMIRQLASEAKLNDERVLSVVREKVEEVEKDAAITKGRVSKMGNDTLRKMEAIAKEQATSALQETKRVSALKENLESKISAQSQQLSQGLAAANARLMHVLNDVNKFLSVLDKRLKTVEATYIDQRRTVHLRNHAKNKYLDSSGNLSAKSNSVHANYSIHH